MRHILIAIFLCVGLSATARQPDVLLQLPPIQRAVLLIKYFEGWHINKGQYIGWGHRLQPGERLTQYITRAQGDSLLYEDLYKLLVHFKDYGEYALLLTALSYNVGIGKVEGNKTRPPSRLIQKIKQGRKDIEADYLDFCRWNGKTIPSIKRRRWAEFHYLYLNEK